tara:strand:- start:488 stop:715 length:228 start_codon:yes stop_codon:yes gene_type:complete
MPISNRTVDEEVVERIYCVTYWLRVPSTHENNTWQLFLYEIREDHPIPGLHPFSRDLQFPKPVFFQSVYASLKQN